MRKPAICTILFSPDRKLILLIKRRDIPVWVLPGGGIENNENPEDAACREMYEETGIKVRIVRKIAEYTPINRLTSFTHFFEVAPLSGALTTGPETKELQFFPIQNLPKLLAPPYSDWIADAIVTHTMILQKKIQGTSYGKLCKLLIRHPILVGRFLLTLVGIHINSK